jgi:hypothetical protein
VEGAVRGDEDRMKENAIEESGVVIYRARILKDPNTQNTHLQLLLEEEYIKSVNYQKKIKEDGRFFVGGNILYLLLSELFDHITEMFNRIRMDDVNINNEDSTLIFLRKFSRSSEIIEKKIQNIINHPQKTGYEIFDVRMAGMQNNIAFSRTEGKNAKMRIAIPMDYLYSRLISYMDKMQFTDIPNLDTAIRDAFLKRFNELNSKIQDKRQQIEVKYALELAQERIHDLEDENAELHRKVISLDNEAQLYKRSYMLLRKRFEKMLQKLKVRDAGEQELEEL